MATATWLRRNGRLLAVALVAVTFFVTTSESPPTTATAEDVPLAMAVADVRPPARTGPVTDLGPAVLFTLEEPALVVVPLPPPASDAFSSPLLAYIVRQADGSFDAFEARSTHFLCRVSWDPDAERFIDVCHRFAWDIKGTFVVSADGTAWAQDEQPDTFEVAKRDLWHYPAEVDAGGHLLVDFTTHLEGKMRSFACAKDPHEANRAMCITAA